MANSLTSPQGSSTPNPSPQLVICSPPSSIHAPVPISPTSLRRLGESPTLTYIRTLYFPTERELERLHAHNLSDRALRELQARFGTPKNMEKYSSKALPMAPVPSRSTSCRDTEKAAAQLLAAAVAEVRAQYPKRSSSLPRLLPAPSVKTETRAETKEEEKEDLETLPATTYTPSIHRRNTSSTLSNDFSSLRLASPRSTTLSPPLQTYRSLVFRSRTPSPSLRHKDTIPDLQTRRYGFVPPRTPWINIQPPTPGTSPRLPQSGTADTNKLAVPSHRRTRSRGSKAARPSTAPSTHRRSLLLASSVHHAAQRSTRRSPSKRKRNSLCLYPKTRHPFAEIDEIEEKEERDRELPPVPELPFTLVYKQLLHERWATYRALDAERAEGEREEVVAFLAATYPQPSTSTPPRSEAIYPALPPLPPQPAMRPLKGVSKTVETTVSERRLTVSEPRLVPSEKLVDAQSRKEVDKAYFWSLKTQGGKKLKKKGKGREEELRGISAYSESGLGRLV